METTVKKFIALVGITGDPVTNGHVGLAQVAGDTGYFNEVWLMPCYGHRFGKDMASAIHRLVMCNVVTNALGGIYKTSDYEMQHKSDGTAYQTVLGLKADYPDCKFFWIIGSDNAMKIEKWADSEKLRAEIPFWVVPRKGTVMDPKVTWFHERPHYYMSHTSWEDGISATEVRALLKAGDPSVAKHVHPDVLLYIQTQMDGYYGPAVRTSDPGDGAGSLPAAETGTENQKSTG